RPGGARGGEIGGAGGPGGGRALVLRRQLQSLLRRPGPLADAARDPGPPHPPLRPAQGPPGGPASAGRSAADRRGDPPLRPSRLAGRRRPLAQTGRAGAGPAAGAPLAGRLARQALSRRLVAAARRVPGEPRRPRRRRRRPPERRGERPRGSAPRRRLRMAPRAPAPHRRPGAVRWRRGEIGRLRSNEALIAAGVPIARRRRRRSRATKFSPEGRKFKPESRPTGRTAEERPRIPAISRSAPPFHRMEPPLPAGAPARPRMPLLAAIRLATDSRAKVLRPAVPGPWI